MNKVSINKEGNIKKEEKELKKEGQGKKEVFKTWKRLLKDRKKRRKRQKEKKRGESPVLIFLCLNHWTRLLIGFSSFFFVLLPWKTNDQFFSPPGDGGT